MLIKELIILVNPKILSIMTALVLGIGTIVSSLSLIGFAAYLISMAALRPGFEQLYLAPALEAGLIERTIPDKPNSRLQQYRLTEKGRSVLK